jgi:indole-3-acetate monooxygenase
VTVTDRPTWTPDGVLAAAQALGSVIAARSAEVEAARRVPRDLLDDLLAAGCLHILRPTSHGGVGADLGWALRVHEALARADASVAWTAMITGGSWIDLAGLPRRSFDALFARSPDVLFAGVFAPTGSISATDGGYRLSGRWSFASGCEDADWLFLNAVEAVEDGVPALRLAVLPRDQVVIEDTWEVSGLRGTGSHHVHVSEVVVPADRTLRPLAEEPCLDEPITRMSSPGLIAMDIAAVAVGTAQGALDDLTALAAGKVPLLSGGVLAANPLFQYELASADTALRAARTLLHASAAAAWEAAVAGSAPTWEQRAHVRAAAAWATSTAAEVVGVAYRAGGGSAVYADCPLQRRLRDVHAITQHFLVKPDTLTTAGAVLAGQEVAAPVF